MSESGQDPAAAPIADPIVALSGGVGAARFLSGLVRVASPENVVAIVNTGDDREFYGVHVAPDLDIVTYTLAGAVNTDLGYGLAGDSFELVETLGRLGHETWFRLGDRDFAHCLHRTLRLRDGAGLAEITNEMRKSLGVATRILPMSEDPCPTRVDLNDGRKIHFEDYMIREGAPDAVEAVDLTAAQAAAPGPGVLEAIASARLILVCPSNPVVSVGPILAVPGVTDALAKSRAPVVAVSPIVGGAPVKGPRESTAPRHRGRGLRGGRGRALPRLDQRLCAGSTRRGSRSGDQGARSCHSGHRLDDGRPRSGGTPGRRDT